MKHNLHNVNLFWLTNSLNINTYWVSHMQNHNNNIRLAKCNAKYTGSKKSCASISGYVNIFHNVAWVCVKPYSNLYGTASVRIGFKV